MNITDVTQQKIKDEVNERLSNNTILYAIGKAFLDLYPQYYDIITTYEHALDEMITIVERESTINKHIRINDKTTCAVNIHCANTRIYSPDSAEALRYTSNKICITPNVALATKGNYCCVLVTDLVVTFLESANSTQINNISEWFSNMKAFEVNEPTTITITDGYVVEIPIPVGCKYCALRHYDQLTLRKSAEEMREYYGMFIIEGFIRYIIPTYKKPFNKPIVQKNLYDNQLSRTDVIYAKKFDYEESYCIVVAMVREKQSNVGRRGAKQTHPDFICSLQLNHELMNDSKDSINKRSKKALWNKVPIKYLFYAFGCMNDARMLQYIVPDLNDIPFMNIIKNACLHGFEHLNALEVANIEREERQGCVYLKKPLDRQEALWIIGNIILNEKTKHDAIERSNHKHDLYKEQIIRITQQILNERFMSGVGDGTAIDRDEAICIELGNIIRKLYLIGFNFEVSQDKTALTNRRIRNGQQINREFKAFHNKRLREMFSSLEQFILTNGYNKTRLETKIDQLVKIASTDQSKSLINSFKGVSKENSKLRTDLLNPKNIAFTWNRLREIVITQDTSVQGADVSWAHREVHQSDLYYICPTQTPESGSQTGKYRTPTIYTYITLTSDPKKVIEMCYKNANVKKQHTLSKTSAEEYVIKLNGSCIGWIDHFEPVEELYEQLLQARRDGDIGIDVSVILNHTQKEINIWSDTGRIVTPFVIVKNTFDITPIATEGNLVINAKYSIKKEFVEWLKQLNDDVSLFYEGIKRGFIEFACPDMSVNNLVVADCMKNFMINPLKYTHIALPGHTHGIIANIVSGINLITGVRASYLTNHVKQAIGPTVRYPQCKYINLNNVLTAPQVPIARTCTYDFMHINDYAIGQNVMVAFMQYKDNQEDSIILNRASVEQGLFRIDAIQSFDSKVEHAEDEFKVPDASITFKGNTNGYNNIDPLTALPKDVSLKFHQYDPIICKVENATSNATDSKNIIKSGKDLSTINEIPDGTYQNTVNPRYFRSIVKNSILDNNKFYKKVSFGQYCIPIVGDKFNPEYCQKGTVGKIVNVEEMPYTTNGIKPDIIFNPPSVFKRKTYGHVYFPIIAKLASLLGCQIDITPYHTIRTTEEIEELFKLIGLDEAGYETMYEPITGKPFKCKIFFANHYWERQAHLVEKKINVRNGGPRSLITGQPLKGRKHYGGQSLDHMTYDAEVAAGICYVMQDLHINQGSCMHSGVCNRCHSLLCYYNKAAKAWTCPTCGKHPNITVKELPPATNLLVHIFNGLHIAIDYYKNINEFKASEGISDTPREVTEDDVYEAEQKKVYQQYLAAYNQKKAFKAHANDASNDDVNIKPLTLEDIIQK